MVGISARIGLVATAIVVVVLLLSGVLQEPLETAARAYLIIVGLLALASNWRTLPRRVQALLQKGKDQEAIKLMTPAAERGEPHAMALLGTMYLAGRGVPRDSMRAVALYRQAADKGLASAQARLAYAYSEGQGVVRDEFEAFRWFEKAAKKGNEMAQSQLATRYLQGIGTDVDKEKAIFWLKRAARGKTALARENRAVLAFQLAKTERETKHALELLEDAAKRGSVRARLILSEAYGHAAKAATEESIESFSWGMKAMSHRSQVLHSKNPVECLEWGDAYEAGNGAVERNVTLALACYMRAERYASDENQRKVAQSAQNLLLEKLDPQERAQAISSARSMHR